MGSHSGKWDCLRIGSSDVFSENQTFLERNSAKAFALLLESVTNPSRSLITEGVGVYTDLSFLICCHFSEGPPL